MPVNRDVRERNGKLSSVMLRRLRCAAALLCLCAAPLVLLPTAQAKARTSRAADPGLATDNRSGSPREPGASAESGLDVSTAAVLPITWDPPLAPLVIVYVSINGARPLPFIVDTGFGTSIVVFDWAEERLKLHPNGKTATINFMNVAVRQADGCAVRFLARPDSHDLTANSADAYIAHEPEFVEAYPGPRVAGIIGVSIFRLATVAFDFDRKTLTLFPQPNEPLLHPKEPGAFTIPLVAKPTGDAQDLQLPVGVSGRSASMEIDTGSNVTILPDENAPPSSYADTAASSFTNLAGAQTVKSALMTGLALGDHRLPPVNVLVQPKPTLPLFGMDLLTQYNFIVDARNGFVTFVPRRVAPPALGGETGLSMAFTDVGWTVTSVATGSAADAAGVTAGDRIITIDGVREEILPEWAIGILLAGNAWTPVTLVLDHQETSNGWRRKSVTFERSSRFPLVRHARAGFVFVKKHGESLTVLSVDSASSAYAAGLTAGDSIDSVDGTDVQGLTVSAALDLIDKSGGSSTSLAIKRGDASQTLTLGRPAPSAAPHTGG